MAIKGGKELRGCVGLCNPFDLYTLDMYLETFLFGTFHRVLGHHMLRLFCEHIDALRPLEKKLGAKIEYLIQKISTIRDFDRYVTAKAYGYDSPHSYYRKNSSVTLIEKLQIPTLFISSLDDPIVTYHGSANNNLAR
ncbi:MAG: hypothetical protein P4M11_04130 [Candidatus Pacebacteria bacterium]|nr:hypothetical protein [Candidatus Paceibacterota bacterium]